jgi:hypothetical protein
MKRIIKEHEFLLDAHLIDREIRNQKTSICEAFQKMASL